MASADLTATVTVKIEAEAPLLTHINAAISKVDGKHDAESRSILYCLAAAKTIALLLGDK